MSPDDIFFISPIDADTVADICRIPDTNFRRFDLVFRYQLENLKESYETHGKDPSEVYKKVDSKIKKIKEAADHLLHLIQSLDENTARNLGGYHHANKRASEDIKEDKGVIGRRFLNADSESRRVNFHMYLELMKNAFEIQAAAANYDWRRHLGFSANSKKLDNPYNPNIPFFEEFVVAFVGWVISCGGKVGCDRNGNNSSLNQVLAIVRPYLPEGAIPAFEQVDEHGYIPEQARLERIAAWAKRNMVLKGDKTETENKT